jgi:hypothetical protein
MLIGALAAGGVVISPEYDPPDAEEPNLAGIRAIKAF